MRDYRIRSSKLVRLLIFSALCTTNALSASAATPYSEDAVMAAYLVRFAGYVEWPDEIAKPATTPIDSTASIGTPPSPANQPLTPAPDQAKQPLTIAVLGANGVWDELTNLVATQSARQRPLRIRRITSVADIGEARIVFIGTDYSDRLKRLIAALARKPVLTVTDDAKGLELGSILNFLHADRRIRFEVSLGSAKKAGLKISSDLLAVALRVELATADLPRDRSLETLECFRLAALQ